MYENVLISFEIVTHETQDLKPLRLE